MLRLQIIFNEPRYKMATEFIKRNDNCFLKIPVWIPPVTLDTKKKKKKKQNQFLILIPYIWEDMA